MSDWSGLFTSVERHGVVHVRSGLGFGISEDAMRRRARRERWLSPFPLVFVAPGRSWEDPAVQLAAALASLGSPAYAAGQSALWLQGAIPEDDPPNRPEVLLPHGRRWRPPAGVEVVRSRRLPTSHVVQARDLPSSTIARALCDLAEGGATRARLRALAIRARRLGATTIVNDLVVTRQAFGAGRRGLDVIDQVIRDLATDASDSNAEFRWRRLFSQEGIPVWPGPFPFRCDDGVVVHLDIAIPSAWVVLEFDGEGPHSQPGTFRTDRLRWTQIVRHWSPVWATEEDFAVPERVLAEVKERIARADPTRPPAVPAY